KDEGVFSETSPGCRMLAHPTTDLSRFAPSACGLTRGRGAAAALSAAKVRVPSLRACQNRLLLLFRECEQLLHLHKPYLVAPRGGHLVEPGVLAQYLSQPRRVLMQHRTSVLELYAAQDSAVEMRVQRHAVAPALSDRPASAHTPCVKKDDEPEKRA
ncbi:MAG TPA: hypothetical protein VLL57_06570, partial [Candidatus Binataceae bacterium]|nr:hypothetical protein [Candidatus Binataceae bacterium]